MYVVASPFSGWENFYVIVGSAAAGLIGLMFVAITVIAGARDSRSERAIATFGTPTLIHFGMALSSAALLSVPWPALWMVSLVLGVMGLGGVGYTAVVLWRSREPIDYQPVLEDWIWYRFLPVIAYTTIVIAAALLVGHAVVSLFIFGAVMLLLLFAGIHNAWDIVTYVAITLPNQHSDVPTN
ncbi:MAG: hypothetical protein H0X24_21555 [Ktedonobacterales bacterium]|nr:hypothetical protein [Ktedonobacterales bacterium]